MNISVLKYIEEYIAFLVKYLGTYWYLLVNFTPGLWKYHSNSIAFTLVVDDFGIKYAIKESLEYLTIVLTNKYDITTKPRWK